VEGDGSLQGSTARHLLSRWQAVVAVLQETIACWVGGALVVNSFCRRTTGEVWQQGDFVRFVIYDKTSQIVGNFPYIQTRANICEWSIMKLGSSSNMIVLLIASRRGIPWWCWLGGPTSTKMFSKGQRQLWTPSRSIKASCKRPFV